MSSIFNEHSLTEPGHFVYTLHKSLEHAKSSQSSPVIYLQGIYISVPLTAAHTKSSLHSLNPFLPFLLNYSAKCQLRRLSNSNSRSGSRSRSRSLLPATSRHAHTWHRAPLGPMAIYLFDVKTFVFWFSSFHWTFLLIKEGLVFFYSVAYLPHARKVETQNQPFLSNTHTNNGTVGLCDPFPGYGLVNALPRRRMTSHSNSTGWESRDLFTVQYSWHNNRTGFSVRGRCKVYITQHW
jgi:hypothetical protein